MCHTQPLSGINAWQQSQLRRESNRRAVDTDRAGWATVAFLVTLLSVMKLWREEGRPELAAVGLSHVLVALTLVVACSHPALRRLYVDHRELAVTLASLHSTLISRKIAVNGGTNMFMHHGGSPLRLLGLLLMCSHYIWSAIYLVFCQLSYAWCLFALPLLTLLPLLTERSICHRLVATPGTHPPLQDLHTALNLVHLATVTPAFHIMGAYPSDSPLEQCMAVDTWLLLMVGIALPLAARAALESEARAAFLRRLRRQQAQQQPVERHTRSATGSVGTGSAVAAVRQGSVDEGDLPQVEGDAKPARPHVCWRLLLTSSGAWALSCLAAALWPRSAAV